MAYLYWIHRNKIHTDPLKDGYIGVTNREIEDRYAEHKYHACNEHLRRALDKYDDIVASQLHTGTMEECLQIEKEYRPGRYIGWNSAEGGGLPPKVSVETSQKISLTIKSLGITPYRKGKTHSPESLAKAKESKKGNVWFHNPDDLSTGLFKEGSQPEGWIRGRKPKQKKELRVRGVDYGNISTWEITDPTGCIYEVTNLKNWCRENNIKYNTVFGNHYGWKSKKI